MANYEFRWIPKEPNDERDWCWVKRVFRELSHYYDSYVEDVAEMPFNYTERAFVGSLAVAAHACGCYTLQEYTSKDEKKKDWRFPDFWITLEPQKNSYDVVFEVKKEGTTTDKIIKEYKELIRKGMKEANEHLDKYQIGKREQAQFQGALVAIQIRCKEEQRDKSKYNAIFKDLKSNLGGISKGDTTLVDGECYPFWYLYWLPFEKVNDKEFKKYYWTGKKMVKGDQYKEPALGLLVCGSFKEVEQKKGKPR